jgi:hypothetical protein
VTPHPGPSRGGGAGRGGAGAGGGGGARFSKAMNEVDAGRDRATPEEEEEEGPRDARRWR